MGSILKSLAKGLFDQQSKKTKTLKAANARLSSQAVSYTSVA